MADTPPNPYEPSHTPATPASPIRKIRRNLRALFILGFFFTIPLILGGGLGLLIARMRGSTDETDWLFGQMSLFNGLIHLAIYLALFFQVRSLVKQSPND
ncbi:hypothetical protein KBB96_16185 [Luteolibacter ambystomatis]|uniref:Uncharacterized protein n=1 Tax=Luteolibacter ambystomatis TaxID=2824561 RepID=A0A975G7A0_9BACT|nr:hypothetical protein [Luteolibacter ambystomatis]QUE50394.1 hypothetical protein KBB96_16185 [Luteolibacter ambystomatis]